MSNLSAENPLPGGMGTDDTIPPVWENRNLIEAGIDLEGARRLFKRFHGFVPLSRLLELSAVAPPETDAEVNLTANLDSAADRRLLRVWGSVACLVRRVCARCLTEFSTRLTVEVERSFAPGRDPAAADSQQEMVEELTYLPDYRLSIPAMVEEELLLALPMIPLCHPDCAGLCSGCGVDLNKDKCLCVERPTEGPFALLKKLKTV